MPPFGQVTLAPAGTAPGITISYPAYGPTTSITVTPASATVDIGQPQTYTVTGRDDRGGTVDLTATSTFALSPDGSCTGNSCTAAEPGRHTVTARYSSVSPTATDTATATLTVRPATLRLAASRTFAPIGTRVLLSAAVLVGGRPAPPGTVVAFSETFVDGKTVTLGRAGTLADGVAALSIRPLYIGRITATALGGAASTLSKVIVTYRSATATATVAGHGLVRVHAETRPGFIAAAARQEGAQVLETDMNGRQLRVLKIVNAGQRKLFPGEAQGTNAIDATVTLPSGVHYLQVRVIGTPVNTGATSKVVSVAIAYLRYPLPPRSP